MLNISQLFFTSDPAEPSLLANLDLDAEQKTEIQNAKGLVRAALREGIPRIYAELGHPGKAPQPRFFTQGSWAYKTLNAPCQSPQEADIDDGCYLPMTFVTGQTKRPSVAAASFFKIAEAALAPIVEAKKWKFSDKPKATCIRIHISKLAHIDIPLYAIPDAEFEKLKKSAALDAVASVNFQERIDRWDVLPLDQVLLAHREKDWTPSDPRPLNDWFIEQVNVQGPQLRRVVRYLKAYRDKQWPEGGPASVLLMAAAAPLFQQELGRDDQSLLNVVKGLPAALRAGVDHPTEEPPESLTDRFRKAGEAEGRDLVEEAAQSFARFAAVLEATLAAGNAAQGIIWMQQEFGKRFPNRPDRVKVTAAPTSTSTSAAAAGVASIIASTPAKAGPSPLVGPTHAG